MQVGFVAARSTHSGEHMSSFISPFKVCGACGSVGEKARHNYQQNCPIFVATIFKELAAASLSQLNLFPRVGYTHRHGGAYAFYQYLPVLRDAPHRPTITMSTYLRLGYPVILVRARTRLRRRNHLQTAGGGCECMLSKRSRLEECGASPKASIAPGQRG